MSIPVFPAYAQFLLDDHQMQATSGVDRTGMDDGYIAQVPIQSLTRYELALTYRLCGPDDRDAFETWRRVDLVQGARYFAWPDVYDESGSTVRRARIVNGTVTYKPVNALMYDFIASFTLEFWR